MTKKLLNLQYLCCHNSQETSRLGTTSLRLQSALDESVFFGQASHAPTPDAHHSR